jgi:hypothetical protein
MIKQLGWLREVEGGAENSYTAANGSIYIN